MCFYLQKIILSSVFVSRQINVSVSKSSDLFAIAQDCLELLNNLIRKSASNQVFIPAYFSLI